MTDREHLVALLNGHEAFRALVYDDATGRPITPGTTVVGHPTIGWGHALDVRGLTRPQADRIRDETLDDLDHGLRLRLPVYHALNGVRRAVLLMLAYNMGIRGLLGFRRMLLALSLHDWPRAEQELRESKWATQVGPARTNDLAGLIYTGRWPGASS